jgi:hypothetical protein
LTLRHSGQLLQQRLFLHQFRACVVRKIAPIWINLAVAVRGSDTNILCSAGMNPACIQIEAMTLRTIFQNRSANDGGFNKVPQGWLIRIGLIR